MFKLYEIGNNWYDEGVLISSHKTKELAEKRMMREAKKKVKTVYYIRTNLLDENTTVYDYGLWNRFLKIVKIEGDDEK